MRIRIALAAACTLSFACFTPRSVGFGQTGSLLHEGEVEVGLSPGLAYRSESSPPLPISVNGTESSTSAGIQLPSIEGNLAYGLGDVAALNLHLSSAGLQPGAKIRLVDGPVRLAALPEVGFGFVSSGGSTTVVDNGQSVTQNRQLQSIFDVLVGFKVIASHESGIYGGVGYDFEYVSVLGGSIDSSSNSPSSSTASTTWHNLLLAVGYELSASAVRIRPELSMLIAPTSTTTTSTTETPGGAAQSFSQPGGSAFTLFANVTFAVVGSRK